MPKHHRHSPLEFKKTTSWIKEDPNTSWIKEDPNIDKTSLGIKTVGITKIRLYSFDPLKPHFYIGKQGFTWVYIIFLISAQKHRLWVLVSLAEAVLTSTHNLCFEQKYEKYQTFLSENFQVLEVKFSIYLNRRVSVMELLK